MIDSDIVPLVLFIKIKSQLVFSLSHLVKLSQVNYTQLGQICNLWRNYGDIQDSWDSVLQIIDWFFDNQDVLTPAAGPGRWNDPDMVRITDIITDTTYTYTLFLINNHLIC